MEEQKNIVTWDLKMEKFSTMKRVIRNKIKKKMTFSVSSIFEFFKIYEILARFKHKSLESVTEKKEREREIKGNG